MSNDLSQLWIKQELCKQGKMLSQLEKTYKSLADCNTSYANGIRKMIKVRRKLIQVLMEVDE